jgi:hypothetical protein
MSKFTGFIQRLAEDCPDLKFWKWHTDVDDHLWYAERVNGRVAMLVLTTVLILELVSNRSIWDIIHVS